MFFLRFCSTVHVFSIPFHFGELSFCCCFYFLNNNCNVASLFFGHIIDSSKKKRTLIPIFFSLVHFIWFVDSNIKCVLLLDCIMHSVYPLNFPS